MVVTCSKWIAACLAYLVTSPANLEAPRRPDPLLWGNLTPGRFAVGYRSSFEFDYARQYDPEYPTDPFAKPKSKPRPILVDIWYPARKTAAHPMKYREYLEPGSGNPQLANLVQRLAHNMRDVVSEETVGKVPAKASTAEKAAFDRLLATNTFAVKNAAAAAGRFPVVIYHPGVNGTPEDNSALFEYLASHGYVVISSAYQEPDGYSVRCGGGGMPCDFRDMEFLTRYARGLKFADADRLGAMGHSLGAWEVFAWVAEPDSAVRAFVSLDSGLEYDTVETSGVESLQYQMKHNKDNIRAASLRFASKERDANFENIAPYLKYGAQYQVTVEGLTHNDYLTHGAIRPALLPAKWPDASRRLSYDLICKDVLTYLDATLSGKPEAKKALVQSGQVEDPKTRATLRYRPPTPARPTPRQLSQYVRRHGPEQTIALMPSLGGNTEWAIPAAHVLLQDGDTKLALSLLRLIERDRPNLVSVQAMLGQALILDGDREGALAAFRKGQEILSVDKTDAPMWKYAIDEGLKELSRSNPPRKTP